MCNLRLRLYTQKLKIATQLTIFLRLSGHLCPYSLKIPFVFCEIFEKIVTKGLQISKAFLRFPSFFLRFSITFSHSRPRYHSQMHDSAPSRSLMSGSPYHAKTGRRAVRSLTVSEKTASQIVNSCKQTGIHPHCQKGEQPILKTAPHHLIRQQKLQRQIDNSQQQ